MSTPVTMPQLGLTMVEGTITRWLRQPGEAVHKGDMLFEVSTDKITVECEASADGILGAILVPEGGTVPVGTVLATLGEGAPAAPPATVYVPASPYAKSLSRARGIDLATIHGTGPRGMVVGRNVAQGQNPAPTPVRATPLAERLAAASGVDLAGLAGDGRIRKVDVLAALDGRSQPPVPSPAAPTVSPKPATPAAPPRSRREPLTPVRRTIARRMAASAQTSPHVTLFSDVVADGLVTLRHQLNEGRPTGEQVTVTDLLVLVVSRVLREFSYVNASLEGDDLIFWDDVNVGVAVALEAGLIVPVLRSADRLSLLQISTSLKDLASRARAGSLRPDEVTGGTFTVSNLGMFGIDGFTPIINPPEAAILGVGRLVEKPVWRGGLWEPQRFMTLSLSFDHRVMDGAQGARFLQRIATLVDRPAQLLL